MQYNISDVPMNHVLAFGGLGVTSTVHNPYWHPTSIPSLIKAKLTLKSTCDHIIMIVVEQRVMAMLIFLGKHGLLQL